MYNSQGMQKIKKLLSRVLHFLKKLPWRRIFLVAVPFALGIGLGWSITYFSMRNDTPKPLHSKDGKPLMSEISPEQRQKNTLEQLDRSLARAKERVKTDQDAKTITKDQADKITKKQSEIYEYRKQLKQDSDEDRKKLSEKRTEWRNWLKENNLSIKYFSGLM